MQHKKNERKYGPQFVVNNQRTFETILESYPFLYDHRKEMGQVICRRTGTEWYALLRLPKGIHPSDLISLMENLEGDFAVHDKNGYLKYARCRDTLVLTE